MEPIFADLLKIKRFTKPGLSKADARRLAKQMLKGFCQKWAHEAAFVGYLVREWGEKLGEWLHPITGLHNTYTIWKRSKSVNATARRDGHANLQRPGRLCHQLHVSHRGMAQSSQGTPKPS